MYHMLTGRFAFSGPTKDIKQNILNRRSFRFEKNYRPIRSEEP